MNETDLQLGDEVQNEYTGTEGTVTCISYHLTGCTRVAVRPSGHDPTEHYDDEFYYSSELQVIQSVHQRNLENKPDGVQETEIELGNVVRDAVTGIEGIVGVITHEFFNCPRVGVFPSVGDDDEDKHSNDSEWFDLPRVEYVDDGVADEYSELSESDDEQSTGPMGADRGAKPNSLRNDVPSL